MLQALKKKRNGVLPLTPGTGQPAALDDLTEFEKRMLTVIQAQVECEVPDWAKGPFHDDVYDPVLDDGVKVNITPLQAAGVLRQRRVV